MEEKQPNLLPKISLPYQHSFEAVFTIASQGLNREKPSCKIYERNIDIAYMRSHVAKHILKRRDVKTLLRFLWACSYWKF